MLLKIDTNMEVDPDCLFPCELIAKKLKNVLTIPSLIMGNLIFLLEKK